MSAKISVRQSVKFSITEANIPVVFHTFTGFDLDGEHVAIQFEGHKGKSSTPLIRVHSECLTGDIFKSRRCDCGKQLDEAIELLAANGGYLLYLRQEGRGIGLYNKLDSYKLQDSGFDTFEANIKLGFEEDLRNFDIAAQMLLALGVNKVELLTNNKEKERSLTENGIEVVSVIPTMRYQCADNARYLEAKASKNHKFGQLAQF